MLVTMSHKELNRIPVLQQVCDKLLTQIHARVKGNKINL